MILLIIHSTKNYATYDDKVEYIEHLFAEQDRTPLLREQGRSIFLNNIFSGQHRSRCDHGRKTGQVTKKVSCGQLCFELNLSVCKRF